MPAFLIKAVVQWPVPPLYAKVASHTGQVSGWTTDEWEAKHFATKAAAMRLFDQLKVMPPEVMLLPTPPACADGQTYKIGVYQADMQTHTAVSDQHPIAGR